MRKVLFLMFLLLLMGLGAASVKAQVRIGGNGAPNAAAVLDLNATDATTGTKGLALPRVDLTSATMPLTAGVANLTGMMVYNTTATLGAGIYFWNGVNWVQANLPPTSAPDSGMVLISNGNTAVWSWLNDSMDTTSLHLTTISPPLDITWTLVLDIITPVSIKPHSEIQIPVDGLSGHDLCNLYNLNGFQNAGIEIENGYLWVKCYLGSRCLGNIHVRCYRASA